MSTPKKPSISRLIELQSTRDDSTFILRFLLNLARTARSIRTNPSGRPSEATQEARKYFIIALVGCLETFFRDMFIYCLEKKPGLMDAFLQETGIQISSADRQRASQAQIPLSEYISGTVNFQNLDAIERNFRCFFTGSGSLFSRLNSLEKIVSIPSRAEKGLAKLTLPPDWRAVLDELLRLRHRLTHDANYTPELPNQTLAKYEAYAAWIPQFFHFAVAEHIPSHSILVDQNRRPVFLIIDDLVSDDWVIVPQEGATEKQQGPS